MQYLTKLLVVTVSTNGKKYSKNKQQTPNQHKSHPADADRGWKF